MAITDPIADMLTRIRNATRNRAKTTVCRNSKVCRGIAEVLREEGYIEKFDVVEDGKQGLIRVHLRYGPSGEPIFSMLRRESRPGRRIYRKVEELPRPKQGLGVCIVSTSAGVKSDRVCRHERVGGELLCTVQ